MVTTWEEGLCTVFRDFQLDIPTHPCFPPARSSAEAATMKLETPILTKSLCHEDRPNVIDVSQSTRVSRGRVRRDFSRTSSVIAGSTHTYIPGSIQLATRAIPAAIRATELGTAVAIATGVEESRLRVGEREIHEFPIKDDATLTLPPPIAQAVPPAKVTASARGEMEVKGEGASVFYGSGRRYSRSRDYYIFFNRF